MSTGRLGVVAAVPEIAPHKSRKAKHHKQGEGYDEKFPIFLMHWPSLGFKHIGQHTC